MPIEWDTGFFGLGAQEGWSGDDTVTWVEEAAGVGAEEGRRESGFCHVPSPSLSRSLRLGAGFHCQNLIPLPLPTALPEPAGGGGAQAEPAPPGPKYHPCFCQSGLRELPGLLPSYFQKPRSPTPK